MFVGPSCYQRHAVGHSSKIKVTHSSRVIYPRAISPRSARLGKYVYRLRPKLSETSRNIFSRTCEVETKKKKWYLYVLTHYFK